MPDSALFNLIIKIVIFIGIGFFLRKRGLFDDAFQSKLSFLLVNVIVPMQAIASGNTARAEGMAFNFIIVAIVSVVSLALSHLLAAGVSHALHLQPKDRGLFSNLIVYANCGFIGIPLVLEMFGAEGTLYALIYNMLQFLSTYTVGVMLLRQGKETGGVKSLLLNHMTLIGIFSLVLFLSPLRLPTVIVDTCAQVGAMSSPIALFIVGASLASLRLRELLVDGYSWIVNIIRLIGLPLATAGLLYAFGLRGTLPATLVILASLPPAAINVVLAEKYGNDVRFAARATVQGTALMIITLPLMHIFTTWLFY